MSRAQHQQRHEVRFATVHGHRRAYVKQSATQCSRRTCSGTGSRPSPAPTTASGGYANGMRDLLAVLGIDKATVIGHSFGGGVAMQFAYQFPERTARMVLVSSGASASR